MFTISMEVLPRSRHFKIPMYLIAFQLRRFRWQITGFQKHFNLRLTRADMAAIPS